MLEVADNLESAQNAIPRDVLQQGAEVPAEKALGYLRSLLEGVQATERVLHKVGVWFCITAVTAAELLHAAAEHGVCKHRLKPKLSHQFRTLDTPMLL